MTEEMLRNKIYELLGLEIGSLSSESGNDWERAKKEILEEERKKEIESSKKKDAKIDYSSLDKNDDAFIEALTSKSCAYQHPKSLIARRFDLSESDILKLIETGDKDTIIALSASQKLSPKAIDLIIEDCVYLAKKLLIQNQRLAPAQKQRLKELMERSFTLYKDLIHSF